MSPHPLDSGLFSLVLKGFLLDPLPGFSVCTGPYFSPLRVQSSSLLSPQPIQTDALSCLLLRKVISPGSAAAPSLTQVLRVGKTTHSSLFIETIYWHYKSALGGDTKKIFYK